MTLRTRSFTARFALTAAISLALLLALAGCGSSSRGGVPHLQPSPVNPVPPPVAAPQPDPSPEPPPIAQQPAGPQITVVPLWESRVSTSREWTEHAYEVVEKYGTAMLDGASDIKDFCPAYFSRTRDERVGFWVFLVSAVVKYESDFNPADRMREGGLGTDSVTGQPVYSEGLLSLSYQDAGVYPFCNEFDWKADSKLKVSDPRRTIFDPFKNLSCGIRILNSLVAKRDRISFSSGHYWSVLMSGSAYSKVASIQALTRALAVCKP